MEELLPVIVIGAIMAFLVYKNLQKITLKIDEKNDEKNQKIQNKSFYGEFISFAEDEIKELKYNIENNKLSLVDFEQHEAINFLNENISKLAYLESYGTRQKTKKLIEKDLFEILEKIDGFILNYVKNGEEIAQTLKDDLFDKYESLKKDFDE